MKIAIIIVVFLGVSLCESVSAQTPEESVAFILGIEANNLIKIVSQAPATFEERLLADGPVVSKVTIKSIDACRYTRTMIVDQNIVRITGSVTFNFASAFSIRSLERLPNGESIARIPGLQASNCTMVSTIVPGANEEIDKLSLDDRTIFATKLAMMNKQYEATSTQICDRINASGLTVSQKYSVERANRALGGVDI